MDLRVLCKRCQKFRIDNGFYQSQVALETGYSIENISAFECGRNDNLRILLWYFSHGMTYDYLMGVNDNGENI